MEIVASQLEMESSTSSEVVAFTAALDTLLAGGQQAEGKVLLMLGEVDLE